jgi:hypothetical protein
MVDVTGVVEIMTFVVRAIPVMKALPAVRKVNVYLADGLTHRVVRGEYARKDLSASRIISAINVGGMNIPVVKGARVKRDFPAGWMNSAANAVGRTCHAVMIIDVWKVMVFVVLKVSASNVVGSMLPAVRTIPVGKAMFAPRMAPVNYVDMKTSPAVRAINVIHGTTAARKTAASLAGNWMKQAAQVGLARDGSSSRMDYASTHSK